ncbi:MAG: rod shape-determining protein MreC [Crocinitomicaceae bacterium]|nr:rod shape-determining protein MreC [Crocinitomicaceae bacterium]
MRNLIQLIWKYHFILLFVFAEIVCFGILIQNNSFHKANFLDSANEMSGDAFQTLNEAKEYIELKAVNKSLSEENARLRSEAQTAYFSLTPDVRFFNDSAHLLQYEFLSSKVINSTSSKRSNYLTLDRGERNDVMPEMGIISDNGVVGIVKTTSTNYSFAISLLHKDTKVSARLKSNNYFGILTWDGSNPKVAQLDDIPAHVILKVGDTLVTRGSGTVFPPDVLIGTVRDFEKIEGTDFQAINIDLSVDFGNISYVYVVRNKLKIEQQQIETLEEE